MIYHRHRHHLVEELRSLQVVLLVEVVLLQVCRFLLPRPMLIYLRRLHLRHFEEEILPIKFVVQVEVVVP